MKKTFSITRKHASGINILFVCISTILLLNTSHIIATPPDSVASYYQTTPDWSISDDFNSIDWNKWCYRKDLDDGIGEGSNYAYIVDNSYLSLKGDKSTLKGGGLSTLTTGKYGFYQCKYRVIGINKGERNAWHPAIWGHKSNKGATWKALNPMPDYYIEIDIVEYYNPPNWNSHGIPKSKFGNSPAAKMISHNTNLGSWWRTMGLEYHPNYLQLWEHYGGSWKKIGTKVWFSTESNSSTKINQKHRAPCYWILSNKYSDPEGNRNNTWMHVDYFHYYPYIPGDSGGSYCGWTQQSGAALDIAACNNHVYVVGTNNYLYKSNGNGGWTNVNNTKKIKRIDVTTNGDVFAIGTDNKVWQWKTDNRWLDKNGTGLDIGIGGNQIYVIGTDSKIRKYNGNGNWSSPLGTGRGKNIDVTSSGTPWVRGMNDRLYQWSSNANKWNVKGTLTIRDVGIKPNGGTVVVTGQDQSIYVYAGNGNYTKLTGKAVTVTVNSNGVPWLVNINKNLYKGKCAAESVLKSANASLSTTSFENVSENWLSIYPNPATDKLNLSLAGELQSNAKLIVFNNKGQVVISEAVSEYNHTLSLSNLNTGIYIIKVINGSLVTNEKFIKK